MTIVSLNVNQLIARSLAAGCQAREIIAFVKGVLLVGKDNVVFLYEVPFYEGANGHFSGIKQIHDEILAEFEKYEVFGATEREAYFCTLAIANKESGWERETGDARFQVYEEDKKGKKEPVKQNRFMELTHRSGLRVLGVHGSQDACFLQHLVNYVGASSQKFMLIGDLNLHTGKKCGKRKDLQTLQELLCDITPEDTTTFFAAKEKKVIDRALVSSDLVDKSTMKVLSREKLELSDHAVIVVDIQV